MSFPGYRVEIEPSRQGQYFIHVVAIANGKIVVASECFSSHWNARRAARRLSRALGGAQVVEAT